MSVFPSHALWPARLRCSVVLGTLLAWVVAAKPVYAQPGAAPASVAAEVPLDPFAAVQNATTEPAADDAGLEPAPEPVSTLGLKAPPEPIPVREIANDEATALPVVKPQQPEQYGLASWYGAQLHQRRTASGERFDMHALTAAHRTLPFGSRVCVRSAVTGREVVVRINDRGPHSGNRVIDLSRAAAEALGMIGMGAKPVSIISLADDDESCPES